MSVTEPSPAMTTDAPSDAPASQPAVSLGSTTSAAARRLAAASAAGTPTATASTAVPPSWQRRVATTLGLTRTGTIVAVTAVLGWLLARVVGGKTLFLLAYGAVVVLVVARFLGRRRPAVTAERSELPGRLRQGQSADIELRVRAPRRTGLFLVQERLHPHLGRARTVPVSDAAPEGLAIRYTVTPRLRGVYDVGPLVAIWTDPFGLSKRETELLAPARVVVHPATEAVTDRPLTRQWEDPPVRPPVSKPWPSGFEFYGMRDYVPGDDLRRVVWRAVARTGRMLTRESEQGITDRVLIVVDNDGRTHSPGDVSDSFEAAVKTAASLGTRHLRNGFAVTMLDNQTELGRWRGPVARVPMLDALAQLQRSTVPLADAVEQVVRAGARDAHTVVITPHLDRVAASRLRLLVQGGTTLVVVMVTWEDSDPDSLHRAGALGCQVVRLRPLAPIGAAFLASTASAFSAGTGRATT